MFTHVYTLTSECPPPHCLIRTLLCGTIWGTSKNFVCGCTCWTLKFWLSLNLSFSTFTTHQYTNFVQKSHNFAKIGCFLPSFAQNTPNLCKLGAFICDETHPITLPKYVKKHPERPAHIRIPCQCEYPLWGHDEGKWVACCQYSISTFQYRAFSHDLLRVWWR